MKISRRVFIILFLFLEYISQMFNPAALYSQTVKNGGHHQVVLALQNGFSSDGAVTPDWIEALRYLRHQPGISAGQFGQKTLTAEETTWANLIKTKLPGWAAMADSLAIPFGSITPPGTVTILLGNQGGEDAFLYKDSTICFDLHKLHHEYGDARAAINVDRIGRFFAHEFTHVLHKAWRKQHPLNLNTPLDAALWNCLTEGLGNYRSLSDKWVTENGALTDHAKAVLSRLQPVFVQRISALRHAGDEEAAKLMEGLSMGPFEQKWGALTVALWLAQEAQGDDANLQKWVEAGPEGILTLAQKYLPEELKGAIRNTAEGEIHPPPVLTKVNSQTHQLLNRLRV